MLLGTVIIVDLALSTCCINQCGNSCNETTVKVSSFKPRLNNKVNDPSCHQISQPSFKSPAYFDPCFSLLLCHS